MHETYGVFRRQDKVQQICTLSIKRQSAIVPVSECGVKLKIQVDADKLKLEILETNANLDYALELHLPTNNPETYYGLGTQFSHFVLNGRKFPILSQEQGNGRGLQPISFYQSIFARGLAGNAKTTYAALPVFVTSDSKAYLVDTYAYGEIDFTNPREIGFYFQDKTLTLKTFQEADPESLTEVLSLELGRMRPLPSWIHSGLLAGLVGGAQSVERKVNRFKSMGIPLAGVWIQDWVGIRQTIIGERLLWDWRKDEKLYPNYPTRNLPVLGYFNPFLSSTDRRSSRNGTLFDKAVSQDFLMKVNGKLAPVSMGGFEGHLVNLFNPSARSWLKEIMKTQVRENNFKGWMADFSEAWSFEADLPIPFDRSGAHHLYILEWLKLNREIVEELGDPDLTFFARASTLKGSAHSTLFWLGDQMPTWDDKDGLKTTVIGLLSSGVSGQVYNHSDLGGYAEICFRPFFCYRRTPELIKRWLEINAFTALMRNHEGLNPENSLQIHSTADLLLTTKYWVNVFRSLMPYREKLIQEASENGLPLVRPMFYYDSSITAQKIEDQFYLGRDLLIAPVMDQGKTTREVYLPAGEWEHLFTGATYQSNGESFRIKAPLGQPGVFFNSEFPREIVEEIRGHFYPPSKN